MRKSTLPSVMALLGIALAAHSQAVTIESGDLILGFKATSGTGQQSNLEINLGNISNYKDLSANTTFTITSVNALNTSERFSLGADLVATYGSGWNTRADLTFGVIGSNTTTGFSNQIGFLTQGNQAGELPKGLSTYARPSIDTSTTAAGIYAPYTSLVQDTANGLFRASATENNSYAGIVDVLVSGVNNLNSWTVATSNNGNVVTAVVGRRPAISYASFSVNTDFSDSDWQVLDLYEVTWDSTSGTYLGTFGLDADGNLAFSNNPSFFSFPPDYSQVPESATYAILIGALALGFVGYRRWKLNREVLAA